ncbi:hypothetical protein ACLB1R_03210 [Escherichia coli]
MLATFAILANSCCILPCWNLKPRNKFCAGKTDYSGGRGFNPKPVFKPGFKKSCGHDWRKPEEIPTTWILARASRIPVLSGLPLDAIARYAGQPAVLRPVRRAGD